MPLVSYPDSSTSPLDSLRLAMSIITVLDSSIAPSHAYELAKTATQHILSISNEQKLTPKAIAVETHAVLIRYSKRAALQYGAKYNLIKF